MEKDPSLILSKVAMDYATLIYSSGTFKSKKKFEEVVQKHIFLNREQNEALKKHLKLEEVFRKYQRSPRFRHLLDYMNQLLKVVKDTRVSQRPLFCTVAALDDLIKKVREKGTSFGLV